MVPVIDLAAYLRGERGALESTAEQVRSALVDVGFFSIVGHGVPWSQVEGIYAQAARYHGLPDEAKLGQRMGPGNMGYIPLGDAQRGDRKPALNTAFFMGRPGSHRNRFPDPAELPGFEQAAGEYYAAMDTLCHRLLHLYAVAAGMPAGHFDQYFDPALATLRMTHYPPIPADVDQWGIDPHSDAGFMTLLPTNEVPGLWIRPPSGDWEPVDQEPESFVVNAGDMLRRWSNDVFLSTTHRAVNETPVDRFAIPFFFDPRVDTVIEVLPSCVDAEHPARHEPLVYRDYLTEFMASGYASVRG